ncbi:MAG: energy transducer TonB [Leptospiraceae bacterium]|nr:energy transducer TonB [Leptospiraceae bacterium]
MTTITRTKTQLVHRFIDRNRLDIGLLVAAIFQVIAIHLWYQYEGINLFYPKEYVDEIMCPVEVKIEEDIISLDGDIEIVDRLNENLTLLYAPDYNLIGATEPIDLRPRIKPKLTKEAKENEVQGTLTLEIIVADTGDVLQVRSVGRKIGFGIEESAIMTYKAKKFYPSFQNNKPVTVKKLVSVRFELDDTI